MGKKTITNLEVREALDDAIHGAWSRRAVSPVGRSYDHGACALCDLFGGGNRVVYLVGGIKKIVPIRQCRGCPVYLRNGGKGCGDGSTFMDWHGATTQKLAQRMLKELNEARDFYFGDGQR